MTVKKPDKAQAQLAKFKQTAKQVETDDSEEAFDRVLKKVAKPVEGKDKART